MKFLFIFPFILPKLILAQPTTTNSTLRVQEYEDYILTDVIQCPDISRCDNIPRYGRTLNTEFNVLYSSGVQLLNALEHPIYKAEFVLIDPLTHVSIIDELLVVPEYTNLLTATLGFSHLLRSDNTCIIQNTNNSVAVHKMRYEAFEIAMPDRLKVFYLYEKVRVFTRLIEMKPITHRRIKSLCKYVYQYGDFRDFRGRN